MRRRLPLAALIALLLLAVYPHGSPAVPAPRVSGKLVGGEIAHSMPAFGAGELRTEAGRVVAASTGAMEGTLSLTSPALEPGQLFSHAGIHWRAAPGKEDTLHVELRTSADGSSWSEWRTMPPDEDLADVRNNVWYSMPYEAIPGARYAQYRVWLTDGDPAALEHIAVTAIDVNDLNQPAPYRLFNDLKGALADIARSFSEGSVANAASGPPRIYTRQDWAADESIFRWMPRYHPVSKAVIHHTVTGDGGTNRAADEIRAIYYFHAVTRGWGDIGYQYLVDKHGNTWTGRAGGDHVIGGHAFGWNDGTFAVAAIGDYSVRTPTDAMQQSIAKIIAMKFRQLGIPPAGSGRYTHKETNPDGSRIEVTTVTPNIIGHRDCTFEVGKPGAQTACPGGRLYGLMDALRGRSQEIWQVGFDVLSRIDPQLPAGGFPGEQIKAPVLITNAGLTPIPAGTTLAYQLLERGNVLLQGTAGMVSTAIPAGSTAAVEALFTGPPKGEYILRWGLQTQGVWWNALYNDPWREVRFRSADWSARWTSGVPSRWTAGETRPIGVYLRNDGGRTWNATGANPVRVGYYWINADIGARIEGLQKVALPRDVLPGDEISLTVPVVAPSLPGPYTHVFDLHKENEFWFQDKGLRPDDTTVAVGTDFQARYNVSLPLPRFESGATATIPVTITNTGTGTFPRAGANPVVLGYHWIGQNGLPAVWDGTRTKLPADLAAGQSVTLQATVTPPAKGGSYALQIDLVQEGVAWFGGRGVSPASFAAEVIGPFEPLHGAAVELFGAPSALDAQTTHVIPVQVRNASNFTWDAMVRLSYHWYDAAGNLVVWDGLRTSLAGMAPGETRTVEAQVLTPPPGAHVLRFDVVHEAVTWFSARGLAAAPLPIAVK